MIDIVARKKAPRNPKAAEKYFDAAQAATRAVQSQWLPTTLGVASNLAKTTTKKAKRVFKKFPPATPDSASVVIGPIGGKGCGL